MNRFIWPVTAIIAAVILATGAVLTAHVLGTHNGTSPTTSATTPRPASPGASAGTASSPAPTGALIRRMPPPAPSAYSVLLPATWKFRNASYPSDHATHLWYDPADPLRKMLVVLGSCIGCTERNHNPNEPDPALLMPPGATRYAISKWEAGYLSYFSTEEPFPDNGLVFILHHGNQILGYITVDLWIPASQHALASTILNSFMPGS
jgi:hypothetical protein